MRQRTKPARPEPPAAATRLLDVFEFPDALVQPLASRGIRTVGELLAAALRYDGQHGGILTGRAPAAKGRGRPTAQAVALVLYDATFFRAEWALCERTAARVLAGDGGEGGAS